MLTFLREVSSELTVCLCVAKGYDLGRSSRNLTDGLQWVFSSKIIVFLCHPDQTLDPSAVREPKLASCSYPLEAQEGRRGTSS